MSYYLRLFAIFFLVSAARLLADSDEVIWDVGGVYSLPDSHGLLLVPGGAQVALGEEAKKELMHPEYPIEAVILIPDLPLIAKYGFYEVGDLSPEDLEKLNLEKLSAQWIDAVNGEGAKFLRWLEEPQVEYEKGLIRSVMEIDGETGEREFTLIRLILGQGGFERVNILGCLSTYYDYQEDILALERAFYFAPGYRYSDYQEADGVESSVNVPFFLKGVHSHPYLACLQSVGAIVAVWGIYRFRLRPREKRRVSVV